MRLRVLDVMPTEIYELGGHDTEAFIDAWRQLHYVAQAAAEAGKSWGREAPDDSHSGFEIEGYSIEDPEMVLSEDFVSLTTDPGVFARLDLWQGRIELVRGEEQTREVVGLHADGWSLARLTARVREVMTGYLGPALQDAVPAPDLPEHRVGAGEAFSLSDQELVGDVAWHYSVTASLLGRFARALRSGGDADVHDLTPRIWPHHFDLASLYVAERDGAGAMVKTIGVGLTPPDSVESVGYWYVSPWSKDSLGRAFAPGDLPVGRWEARGEVAMAVLPLSEIWELPGGEVQACAIAEFVAAAFNACMDHFEQA